MESMITLMKFEASWCQPCKAYAPIVEQVVESRTEDVRLEVIDVDENKDLAAKYGVMGVPFTVLKDGDGAVLGAFQGAVPVSKLHKILDTFM